ncbi:pentatricopeptide repeat protein [Talaromyces proteolyticus]|uniref:Pentatricopeptide repeat protein n=1 Tax=Talaromyces proteolyticus TaxID=1131652 RepID=A0AAD4KW87_9EURO|nr:pentatricopeptide repeat protein [Talaromyces proteolyticus]KAH8701140.1 pentatricopeptide repeat protein [Talaromyces proteolyticus]
MLRQVIQGAWRYRYSACSKKCLITRSSFLRRPFSASPSQYVRNVGRGDKIRFFEQDSIGSKNRVEIDPDADDAADREDMKDELAKLDSELESLKKGPFDVDSPFIQNLPEPDRKLAIEALRKYEAEHGQEAHIGEGTGLEKVFDKELDDMIKEEFEGLAKEEEDSWDLRKPLIETDCPVAATETENVPTQSHPYEHRFRNYLELAITQPDTSNIHELWRWYQRSKNNIPSFLESLPPDVLRSLWKAHVQGPQPTPNKLTHMQVLVEDFKSIGRTLSPDETLEYVEVLHSGGDTEKALQMWEEQQVLISSGEGDIDAYWNMGVRLFAASGDPQRAQDIAFAFLSNSESRGCRFARILIPIITAWTKQTDKVATNKAWAIYLQLRTLLGSEMTMGDYDEISIGLLHNGKVDLALAVFKDMMITGGDSANDSTAIFTRAIGLAGHLKSSNIKEEDVNKISLSALTFLPRRLQNKFFYASWMKKLIGMGEVDSAASVVELMFERGVRPDAIHLNGIISGWLRHGSSLSRDKAEQLGWSMIQHRIDTVWNRLQPSPDSSKPSIPSMTEEPRVPQFLKRTLPPANIETFSILLLHYTRRGDDGMIRYLEKCLDDSQIRPNSYFMNHLLYAELRKHRIGPLWQQFQSMSTQVQPDLETFACLWDCGKLQYDRSRRSRMPYDPNFPPVRQLFSMMMHWYTSLNPRAKQQTHAEFSKELYDQITLCFCLSKDLYGTLVSLYALRDIFGYYPDSETARMLVLQITSMAGIPGNTPKKARRRLSSTPRHKENIQNVQTLLQVLEERKASALQAQGLSIDELSEDERKQYQLEILGDLIISVIERTWTGPDHIKEQITTAMQEMGARVDGLPSS